MMKWIFSGLILLSVVFGIGQGRMDAVTNAAIADCGKAVELTLSLAGSMCMWSGLMKIAEKAGLTERISSLFRPVIRFLFSGMDHKSPAAQAITLNISANLLGLGNAATPLGITAMREMQKQTPHSATATNNMVMFVVINTASLQLLPTTTALLRQQAGAAAPLDIMPAAWISSAVTLTVGILMAKLLGGLTAGKRG